MSALTQTGSQRARVGRPPPPPPRAPRAKRPYARIGLLLASPYLLIFLVFRILPSLGGLALSFLDYEITGRVTPVGLDNFRRMFADPLFWTALRVTLTYVAIAVPLVVVVSLVMAHLSVRSIRGIRVYRALYFLPVITSLVTSGVVWQWIYSSDGPLNFMLSLVGLGPASWLGSGALVLPSLSVLGVWARFGYDLLILMAGMLNIPEPLYEAAAIDGANAWQRFRHVTLPQLRRPLFFVVVLELVFSFQIFDVIYVMTGGGPVRSSYSMVFMIYDQGFNYSNFGYASAVGVALFMITLVVSVGQRMFFGKSGKGSS